MDANKGDNGTSRPAGQCPKFRNEKWFGIGRAKGISGLRWQTSRVRRLDPSPGGGFAANDVFRKFLNGTSAKDHPGTSSGCPIRGALVSLADRWFRFAP